MAIEQFITAVLPQHSRSIFDRFLDAEEKEFDKYTIVSSAQELRVIKNAAQAHVDAVFKHVDHIGVVIDCCLLDFYTTIGINNRFIV
jgi:hypothetical protein